MDMVTLFWKSDNGRIFNIKNINYVCPCPAAEGYYDVHMIGEVDPPPISKKDYEDLKDFLEGNRCL